MSVRVDRDSNRAEPEAAGFFRDRSALIGLSAILILYLVLALAFSREMHFSRALDEGYHLEYVTFLKQQGHLPKSYEERAQITRADFPPLYQLLVSRLSTWLNAGDVPELVFYRDSFRYQAIDHHSDQPWMLVTEDFQWPYFGQILIWKIGRWLSIGLSLVTLIVVFFSLRAMPLGRIPFAPPAGAALLAFTPRYIILGSALNDDSLLGLLAALYFLMLVQALKQPRRWWPFVGMGIFLGLSMTVKYSLILIPLEILVICALIARSKGLGWRWGLARIGLVGLLALLCSSWWFGWNIWHLNTVAEDGWPAGLLRPVLAGGTDTTLNRVSGLLSGGQVGLTELPGETIIGTFPEWIETTFLTFWAVGIAGRMPLSPFAFLVIGLLLVASAVGLWQLWRTSPKIRGGRPHQSAAGISNRYWLLLLCFHVGLFLVLPLVRFGLTRRLSVAAQGRHILIPAATAGVALLIWGLAAAVPRRWHRPIFGLLILFMISWTGVHLARFNSLVLQPLALRTLPEAAEWLSHPVGAHFGDNNNIELVSYTLHAEPEQGLLGLELAWRAQGYLNESYLTQVELVDANGQVVSHWRGYQDNGRLPSVAWSPNFSVYDRLTLPLPDLPAGNYSLHVQLLSQGGALPVSAAAGSAQSSRISDTILALAGVNFENPTKFPWTQTAFEPSTDDQLMLWPADGAPGENDLPEYRYPATISVVADRDTVDLEIVDPDGQGRPPSYSQGKVHTFVIGPDWPSGSYSLRTAGDPDHREQGDAVSPPLLSVENWWRRTFTVPDIAHPVDANFADQFSLLGYELPQRSVRAGEAFPLTLYWQARSDRSPQADFTQFNHLHDSTGQLRGGYDRRPLENYGTILWAPGEVVIDGYAVPVDADAPPGEYYLDVGYYLTVGESAVNLPLVVDGSPSEISRITIGPIEVKAP